MSNSDYKNKVKASKTLSTLQHAQILHLDKID